MRPDEAEAIAKEIHTICKLKIWHEAIEEVKEILLNLTK